jgi:uncharacterized Zn finger protein
VQLPEMECPNCGAPVTELHDDNRIRCRFCGTVLDLYRSLCPFCEFINPAETNYCARCGESIVRICPACQHENWAGMEHCTHCGRILDILEIMTRSRTRDTRARIAEQQRDAARIKFEETAQAEARMEQFRQMERERLQEMAATTAAKRRRERQVIAAVLIMLALGILVILTVSILMTSAGQ